MDVYKLEMMHKHYIGRKKVNTKHKAVPPLSFRVLNIHRGMFSITANFTLTADISLLWLGCKISLTEIPEITLK